MTKFSPNVGIVNEKGENWEFAVAWVYAYLHQHRDVSLILSQTNSLELIQIMLRFLKCCPRFEPRFHWWGSMASLPSLHICS